MRLSHRRRSNGFARRQLANLGLSALILLQTGAIYSPERTAHGITSIADAGNTRAQDGLVGASIVLLKGKKKRTAVVAPDGPYEHLRPAYDLPFGMWFNADTGMVEGTSIDTPYDPPGPSKEVVLSDLGDRASNYAALDAAVTTAAADSAGGRIRIQYPYDFGGAYTLPPTTATGDVYIETVAIKEGTFVAEGTKPDESDADYMPKLYSTAVNTPVFLFSAGNARYRFVGLEVTLAPSGVSWGSETGGSENADLGLFSFYTQGSSTSDYPSGIVIDRCYVHGVSGWNCTRAIRINGASVAIIDSRVTDVFGQGFGDGQAILATSGPGPYKIVGNYITQAADGEHWAFGGATAAQIPSDIEIQRNYHDYPVAWHGVRTIKNEGELKVGHRVLVQANIFANYKSEDISSQHFVLVFKSVDQDDAAPMSGVRDLTVRINSFVNCSGGILLGRLPENRGTPMTRVEITCNRQMKPTSDYTNPLTVKKAIPLQIEPTIAEVRIRHNTFNRVTRPGDFVISVAGATAVNIMVDQEFTDNLWLYTDTDVNLWWTNGDGLSSKGLTGWNDVSNSGALGVYRGNAITQSASVPTGNTAVASEAAADFDAVTLVLNPTSPLKGTATNGRDPGAIHALIDAAIYGVAA